MSEAERSTGEGSEAEVSEAEGSEEIENCPLINLIRFEC